MDTTPTQVATAYFEHWQGRDAEGLAPLFADDVEFTGPMGTAHGPEECVRGLLGVRGIVDSIEVVHRWVDGPDVLTWFEFHRAGADPLPVTNWSHVEDGAITRIRVAFDPRPLLG
ncbi:SnoaL-like protein [Motilibacter rhizosphaerae]|uniref:SnoaL-like protein n=1 Tax=Motilibacter rhizosphaerae TaxID=598652 RepID=A0A4Q7NTC1_9ACTN|nr:nuclear transport factor 2 family protein [Motilibacter rhizosphaerae]RZS90048.1 SnoaL-like protein [Motilibacter rhizosphaerae]